MRPSRSRTRSLTAALVAAIALLSTGVATASAQTVDTDFAGGVSDQTYLANGELLLNPTVGAEFEGATLPADWFTSVWSGDGTAQLTGGALVVDGARAGTTATYAPDRWLEFSATFGDADFQHVGFGDDFNGTPYAMFSTGGSALPRGLYARTLATSGAAEDVTRLDPGINPATPHVYRIVWTASGVTYFVDGAQVAEHATAPTDDLRPLASDFIPSVLGAPTPEVKVDWLRMGPYAEDGTFTSRVFDAGDDRTLWQTITADAATPTDTSVALETRTGPTATPDSAWSAWEPVGAAGAIVSPPSGRRYAQYRANLSTDDTDVTPVLHSVSITHTVDSTAPTTTLDPVTVTGTTAHVVFSSEPNATFECSLDGAAFTACTSPHDYSGLAEGAHTVKARATDQVGNVGAAAQRDFTVDTTAPTTTLDPVTVTGTTAHVVFSSEPNATFQCSLDGAAFQACTSPRDYTGLAAGAHTVKVQATDGAGNVGATVERSFTIAAPHQNPPASQPPTTVKDLSAPKIRPLTRSATASRAGKVKLALACPGTETSCRITVKLRYRGATIATKTITVHGDASRSATLKLKRSLRTALAHKGKLTVHALTTARDAAGNVATTDTRIKLRAPK